MGKAGMKAFGIGALRFVGLPTAIAALWLLAMFGAMAMAADGLITLQSHHEPGETMQRLEAAMKAKGMTVFAHIDHAAAAAEVGLRLRPTDLLIFGSPKGGTPLMQLVQTIGIDLPLKALVWQDDKGTTWITYNDMAWVVQRHGGVRPVLRPPFAWRLALSMQSRRKRHRVRPENEIPARPPTRSFPRIESEVHSAGHLFFCLGVESRHCAAGLAPLLAAIRETHPRPVSPPADAAGR
jgi:uncharacterized protein (DUF302 family)